MRERARVVVIGGGVAGASIAYHLAQLGWTDVVVVERDQLTSGSTFHSAGLVGQLRSSVTLTRMMMDGTELYRRLAAETGHDPGWREVGSLRLASSPARLEACARRSRQPSSTPGGMWRLPAVFPRVRAAAQTPEQFVPLVGPAGE